MTKIYRYIQTKGDEKKWQSKENDATYDEYVLEISPKWSSDLNGNPVAILIEAEHIDDNLPELSENRYQYKQIWANFDESENKHSFKSINLLEDSTECNILIYQDFVEDENYYINSTIDKESIIKIPILRIYDGIIKFKLTPIMSYGSLDSLSKTITLDQSKIASGEIILSKWSYYITQNQSSVIKDYNSKTSKTKDTKTSTTKKTTKKSSVVDSNTSQTSDTEEIEEITSVENNSTVYTQDPINYITYSYTMDLTYGFDSYMYENQVVNEHKQYIHFFDVDDLNFDNYKYQDSYNVIKCILDDYKNNKILADYSERIPIEIIRGGNITNKYNLSTSSCKLKYNKLYLVIINLETTLENEDVILEHYDYRYVYTNQVFNDSFNNSEDFNSLSIPIDPSLSIQFDQKSYTNYYKEDGKICSCKDIINELNWIQDTSESNTYSFIFNSEIYNCPKSINIEYTSEGFNTAHTLNTKSDDITLTYEYPENNDYSNNVFQSETLVKETYKDLSTPVKLSKKYTFKINCTQPQYSVLVGAVKTNLLNTTNNVNDYKLFLSELKGLSNTMMFEPNSIFTVGMHNDGDDSDEEWYGEGGSVTEGYTNAISKTYDDSVRFNQDNEMSLDYYNANDTGEMYYYLKHSSDHLIQFGSEKDDVSETFSTYMNADDSPKEIGKSLECRGVAPILFVTSGYSGDDANKTDTCVWAKLGEFKAPSQPANGNVVTEEDDEDEEKNNFNKEHPYWFINWSAVNAFNLKQFLGTFLLKYSTKYGTAKYVTTNNYFLITCQNDKGPVSALYLEDFIRSKYEYNFQGSTIPKNNPRNVIYDNSTFKPSKFTDSPYIHIPSSITQTIEVKSVDYTFVTTHTEYSVGDLLATQLAQFATITDYTIPLEKAITIYTLNDSDKNEVLQLGNEQIVYNRTYTIKLSKTVHDKLNENLEFNGIKLHNINQVLPSKNLSILDFSTDSLKYSEQITFNPLDNLIPNFKENAYMAEITPYGSIKWSPKPSTVNSSTLYVWNETDQLYEPYTNQIDNTKGVSLFKYGKFSKFSNIGSSSSAFFSDHNKLNYDNLTEENELLEGFIKFHPLKESSTINPKHIISSAIHYDKKYGLYTSELKGRDSEITFYFKSEPCNTDSNHRDRQSDDQIASRTITKIAAPPYTDLKGVSPKTYVDPKYRI